MLAAAIVNNDSFPVFVVYGRVANPCSMYYLWFIHTQTVALHSTTIANAFQQNKTQKNCMLASQLHNAEGFEHVFINISAVFSRPCDAAAVTL